MRSANPCGWKRSISGSFPPRNAINDCYDINVTEECEIWHHLSPVLLRRHVLWVLGSVPNGFEFPVICLSYLCVLLFHASPSSFQWQFQQQMSRNWEPARRAFRSKKSGTLFVLGQLTYSSSRLCHQKTGVNDPDTAIISGTSLSGSQRREEWRGE